MKNYIVIICLLTLISCNKNKVTKKSNEELGYELVKIDSFTVYNLTKVRITDFSESENIFLGYSEAENDVLEISPKGIILKRINLSGEGPEKLGNWVPLGLSFGPHGKRVFQLPFQLVTYNEDYKQLENMRIQSPLPVRTNTPLGKTIYFIENEKPRYLVGPNTFLSAHLLIYNDEGRDTLQNFSLLYPESGQMKSIIPYEEDSYFKKTKNIYTDLMNKSFFIDGQKLVVLQGLSETIQVYDLLDFSLTKNIAITHTEFIKYDPVPVGTAYDDPRSKQLSSMAGRNLKIIQLSEDLWLIRYYQGITNAEFEARNSEEEPFRYADASDKIKLLVIKNGKQVSGEISTPEGLMLFSLGKNKILIQEKASIEIEEEFTKYCIYELKELS
jgi:hypothetical protein